MVKVKGFEKLFRGKTKLKKGFPKGDRKNHLRSGASIRKPYEIQGNRIS
jgi:hypothetical protein